MLFRRQNASAVLAKQLSNADAQKGIAHCNQLIRAEYGFSILANHEYHQLLRNLHTRHTSVLNSENWSWLQSPQALWDTNLSMFGPDKEVASSCRWCPIRSCADVEQSSCHIHFSVLFWVKKLYCIDFNKIMVMWLYTLRDATDWHLIHSVIWLSSIWHSGFQVCLVIHFGNVDSSGIGPGLLN